MSDILKKLQDLNLTLPEVAAPVANYLPYKIEQNIIYISGQLPMLQGKVAYQCSSQTWNSKVQRAVKAIGAMPWSRDQSGTLLNPWGVQICFREGTLDAEGL